MKKEAILVIAGPIGSFEFDGKEINGVELIDVVSKVTSLPKDVTVLRVQYDTPGGRKDVGEHIYNYLMGLKPRFEIISEQIGMVGSVGTKPWFAGDRRIATRGKEFFIHNPWIPNVSGDAAKLTTKAAELQASEEEMRAFYMEHTGITAEGIAPLMKAETTFKDEQAVELKFATELQEALSIAAYKSNTMKTKTQEIVDAVALAVKGFLGVEDKPILNMVAELADGKKIAIATEDLSKLEGVLVYTVDDAGAPTQVPAPDAEYPLKDGRKITVVGGKITVVTPAPAADPNAPAQQAMALAVEQLAQIVQQGFAGMSAKIDEAVDAKILAFRNEVKTTHVPTKYKKEDQASLVLEWDRSFKANEHAAMRKNDPEKYKLLYFAKYGKVPTI